MAWIESHQSLATHRKTLLAAAQLNISRPLLIGHLHLLWWWALDNVQSDGSLEEIPDSVVEEAAGWTRRKGAFISALRTVGFITDGRLHDWPQYGGKLQDRRVDDAQRKQRQRADRRGISAGQLQDGAKTAYVDKSRVDKTRQEHPAAAPSVGSPQPTAAAEETVLPLLIDGYENTISANGLNPTIADELRDWAGRLPTGPPGERWIAYAFAEAARQNKPRWSYVEGILKRGEDDGWPPPGRKEESEFVKRTRLLAKEG